MSDTRHLFIDGSWADAGDGSTFETVDPATGLSVGSVPRAGVVDVDRAVAAARRAFDDGPWGPESNPRHRAAVLMRAAEWIRAERERLARLEVADCGKPL